MKKENYFKIILKSSIFALFIQINLFSQSKITFLNCYNFDSCFNKAHSSKDPETKIEYFSQALLLWKDADGIKNKAIAYNNRGNVYQYLEQYDKAISDYNKAIELNPNYAKAYNNRGVAYDDLKQYDKAISDYTKALELNPNYAEAYNNRGLVYSDLKQYGKAISDFNKVIELNPNITYK